MKEYVIEAPRKTLEARRDALIRQWREVQAREQELLDDRPPDWEDLSAEQRDAEMLDRLGETELVQLRAIRAALQRLDDGSYGRCTGCAEPIEAKRLQAIPETPMCIGCQGLAEDARAPLRGGSGRAR